MGTGEVHDRRHESGRLLRQRHPQRTVHQGRAHLPQARSRPQLPRLPGHRAEPVQHRPARFYQRRAVRGLPPGLLLRSRGGEGARPRQGAEGTRQGNRRRQSPGPELTERDMATVRTSPALRRKAVRRRLRTLGFLSPWLVGFTVFFGYPLVAAVYFSFMHYNQIEAPTFVGLRNWRYVFEQMPLFGPALWNTLWLVLVMVALRVVFGLGIGLLCTKVKAGVGFFRTAFYLPYLAPPVAATVAFVFLLNPGTGPVNDILAKIGSSAPNWLNDPTG